MAGADVQLERGYTRIANRLLTAIALAPWDSPSQTRMVLALLRMSYGCRRKSAPIGNTEWMKLTGLSLRQVKHTKGVLQRNGVLVLVQEHDARRRQPQIWRLQKDFTRWTRFRVRADTVEAAESAVAQQLREPGGTEPAPGTASAPGTEPAPVRSVYPGPGTEAAPVLGTEAAPGSAPNIAKSLDPEPSKERERKERNTPPDVPPTARAAAAAVENFCERFEVEWELNDDPLSWIQTRILSDRRYSGLDLVREVQRCGDHWESKLATGEKRKFKAPSRAIRNWLDRAPQYGATRLSQEDEAERDARKRAEAQARATREKIREQQERDEAVREFSDEVRSWLREQPRETQARIELRAKDRAREIGGDDFEPASHPHLLTAYVEQIAAEEAGIEPPPELRGTGNLGRSHPPQDGLRPPTDLRRHA